MAGKIPDLHALVRTGTGKGAARQARREGNVPGIVYGGDIDPLPINIPFNTLLKKLREGRFLSTLYNLKVDGHDDVRVICRNVQRDVVKDLPTHMDLLRLHRNTKIALFIHIEFENEEEAPGIKEGGVLTVIRPEIELVVTASDIPERLTFDLTGREIGDVIHISEFDLPKGSKLTIDRDFVVANITSPTVLAAEDEEEGTEDEIVTEVIAGAHDEEEGEGEGTTEE